MRVPIPVGVHCMSTVVSYSDDVGSGRMSAGGERVSHKGLWVLDRIAATQHSRRAQPVVARSRGLAGGADTDLYDGVTKYADMKQRLDTLAENNTTIVALVRAYSSHATTHAFNTESDKFRNFASAWRDRWNSVMEIFMAGGNYAAAGVPFPAGFPAAVDAEIVAAKSSRE
jgi:hypothetical protein